MLKDENLGKNFQKGMDKFQNMDYNGNESGGQSDAEAWKSENSEALKYAGDEALRSVDKGLSEARDFASEAKKDVNFRDVQDASVKWALAADSNNEELSNSARDELIGILGEGDPEPYMSDVRPLAEFVEAKDNFDYQNGNYTTTENMDKNYDEDVLNMQAYLKENGYTDKFGDPIKLDGYLGGKTMFAIDAYSPNQTEDEPTVITPYGMVKAATTGFSGGGKGGGTRIPSLESRLPKETELYNDGKLSKSIYDAFNIMSKRWFKQQTVEGRKEVAALAQKVRDNKYIVKDCSTDANSQLWNNAQSMVSEIKLDVASIVKKGLKGLDWYGLVKPNGEWDYKVNKPSWMPDTGYFEFYGEIISAADFGNLNYGYTGTVLGISPESLYKGGGSVATNPTQYEKEHFYGDSEVDHEFIKKGIEMANKAGHYGWIDIPIN